MGRVGDEVVDVAVVVVGETEKAYKINDGTTTTWVPKSQVEFDGQTMTMPTWLARDKGLI